MFPSKKIDNNFINQGNRKKRTWKKIKIPVFVLVGLLIIIVILAAIAWSPAKHAYDSAIAGKTSFLKAQDYVVKQEFELASKTLAEATISLTTAHGELQKLKFIQWLPWVGTQLKAVDNILQAGIEAGEGLKGVVDLAETIIAPFKHDDTFTFSSLTKNDKREILKKISEAKPQLLTVKERVDRAVAYINEIPEKGLLKKIKETTAPIKQQVPTLQESFEKAIIATQIIPQVAGYPNPQTYLFLLQNNAEMRPTGGFIGTYGILKVADGEIISFQTDNVYNLDSQAEEYLNVEPPWQLTRYNKVFRWFLRDANWSPDFPTAAQKVQELYRLERGPEKNIHGVVAITQTFIESLLSLTGEIRVNGIQFTKENFVDTLQYQVEQGFLRQGIEASERKEIIGELANILMDRLMALPKKDWPTLLTIIEKDLTEKHIVLFMNDENLQSRIRDAGWAGEIREAPGDYLMVIDANLASLKSDPVVKRSIGYALTEKDGQTIGRVTLTYKHEGTLDWKTTRYRTYTRIYVPQGSQLIKSQGAMVDCKLNEEGSVETVEEAGKTVFGTFLCVEPGEEHHLIFQYTLPPSIIENGKPYSLIVQKQSGTSGHNLAVQLTFDQRWKWITPFDKVAEKEHNRVLFTTDLSRDQEFNIQF